MQNGERRPASELSDQERAYAISWHERQDKLLQEYRLAAIEVSNSVIRALLTLNGGAAIAFSTIVAAMISRPQIDGEVVAAILRPLMAFSCGAGLAVLVGGLAYFTHSADGARESSFRYIWDHPYLAPEPRRERWNRRARFFNWFAVAVAFASLAAFFVGVWLLAGAVVALE